MSRYQVNKILRQVARDDAAKATYLADPEAFLDGCELTDDERKALVATDIRGLYALGVHSFLLFAFVMSVMPGDRRQLEKDYCETVAPLGRVDYST